MVLQQLPPLWGWRLSPTWPHHPLPAVLGWVLTGPILAGAAIIPAWAGLWHSHLL